MSNVVSRNVDLVVIGGGPAGLEASRVAALRGHQVTLLLALRMGWQKMTGMAGSS